MVNKCLRFNRSGLVVFIACLLLSKAFGAETFTPANPPEMQPIRSHHTAAYQAAKLFQHGVNLGDYLEAVRPSVAISNADFANIKAEGFDHVRIPIAWQRYAGPAPDYTLSPEIFARADFAVTNTLNHHLAAIINIHHFDALDHDPAAATPEFLALWRQISEHYRKYPKNLAFELDNEPHDHATTAIMNGIDAQAITLIRATNPKRTLFVEPGDWGAINQITNLVLPSDPNLIVSVHCYDPFYFTHQGAGWAGPDVQVTGVKFPGPPDRPLVPDPKLKLNPWVLDWIKKYNTLPTDENPSSPLAFTGKLHFVREWSDYYGRPVHIGEFGAYTKADQTSRVNFYSAFRQAAEKERLGWCIWDWNSNFHYWDRANNCPLPGMHQALFGKN